MRKIAILGAIRNSFPSSNGRVRKTSPNRRMTIEQLEGRRLLIADYNFIDTNTGGYDPIFESSAVYGNDLYYLDTDTTYGAELRRLNTTTGDVSLVADINAGLGDSFASGLTLYGTKLFFGAYDQYYGNELRWIDLTETTPTIM